MIEWRQRIYRSPKTNCMKRIFFLLLLSALLSVRSFAADEPTAAILVSFHHHFTDATSVSTAQVDELTRISFIRDQKQYCAYYNADAQLVILSHQITLNELPSALREDLDKRFGSYTIADLYQFEKDGKATWYAVLNNRNRHLTLSSEISSWKEFAAIPTNP